MFETKGDLIGWLIVGLRPIVRLWDLGQQGECPPLGLSKGSVFYSSFGENQGKLQTTKSTSTTKDGTWHLPSANFQHGVAQPLVGPRTDSLTSMPYPVLKPGTFSAATGFFNHCTHWSVLIYYATFGALMVFCHPVFWKRSLYKT